MSGLEGIIAAESSICSIVDGVLRYRGINVDELAEHATFEEVIYLLWHGDLPKKEELEKLTRDLSENGDLPEQVVQFLKSIPQNNVHPMTSLRTAVSSLAIYDADAEDMSPEANLQKAIRLMAKTSSIVTAIARIRKGQEPIAPRKDFNFSQNFVYTLTGEEPSSTAVKAMDKAFILHADHEFNASTFAGRVIVATLADIYSGVTGAIGGLKGPLHGGANEAVMKMLEEVGSIERATDYIRERLDQKKKIMGFGHRVYKDGDPRAKHLKAMSQALGESIGETKWYEMSVLIEDMVVGEKGIKPNVDFYSATVYHSLGIPRDVYTPIFAVSRMSGWTAHIMEQYANNRLIRPRADYKGREVAHYIPLSER